MDIIEHTIKNCIYNSHTCTGALTSTTMQTNGSETNTNSIYFNTNQLQAGNSGVAQISSNTTLAKTHPSQEHHISNTNTHTYNFLKQQTNILAIKTAPLISSYKCHIFIVLAEKHSLQYISLVASCNIL